MGEVKVPELQSSAIHSPPEHSEFSAKAHEWGQAAKERVTAKVDHQRGTVASQLTEVASALDETARTLESRGIAGAHQVTAMAAEQLRQVSHAIENHSVDDIIQQVEAQVRKSPVPVLLGCVALGFIGGRLIRNS